MSPPLQIPTPISNKSPINLKTFPIKNFLELSHAWLKIVVYSQKLRFTIFLYTFGNFRLQFKEHQVTWKGFCGTEDKHTPFGRECFPCRLISCKLYCQYQSYSSDLFTAIQPFCLMNLHPPALSRNSQTLTCWSCINILRTELNRKEKSDGP